MTKQTKTPTPKSSNETEKQNPNWKQWIPVYGLYQATTDLIYKRPSVMDLNNHPVLFGLSVAYQTITTPITLSIAVNTLENLLR